MTNDGFMTKVLWPAAKSVDASSLDLVEEGSRVTLAQAVRLQVRAAGTAGAAREFSVAIAEFEPTIVTLRQLRTAAMMMFGRARGGAGSALASETAGVLVGAAFVFAGTDAAEEEDVIRRTAGGRDSRGEPFPIPASVYEQIGAEPARPLLALALWDVQTANDPSLLAIAHAIAAAFFERV